MKNSTKILKIIIVMLIIVTAINNCNRETISAILSPEKPVEVAVLLYDFKDNFISLIGENLKGIQKENEDKVNFTFYDGKSDPSLQSKQIDKILSDSDVDLILLNIVNRGDAQHIIDDIKETNTPVILFNREPLTPEPIQSYGRAIYIGTKPSQAGILQGEMLTDVWRTSQKYIDKNNDNIMQYVMLQGESDNTEAFERSKYSVLSVDSAGIKTQEISLMICDWREDVAYDNVTLLFQKYGDAIEVIISNNDTMAIGASKALQEHGYNTGDKNKTIPIVGVDLIPEAKEFIEKGYILGSVFQYPRSYAESLYICGMNLVEGKSAIEGTDYEFDDTNISIRIPHSHYLYNNIFVDNKAQLK